MNGCAQTKRTPSASRVRRGESSRSRSSWNGVRTRSSATVARAYEKAWVRNGSARDSWKSAPPMGGAARLTAADRPVTTDTAAGICGFGTTDRNAPADAAE